MVSALVWERMDAGRYVYRDCAILTLCEHQPVSTVCACMAKQRSWNFCVKTQQVFVTSTCENRPLRVRTCYRECLRRTRVNQSVKWVGHNFCPVWYIKLDFFWWARYKTNTEHSDTKFTEVCCAMCFPIFLCIPVFWRKKIKTKKNK